MSGHEHVGTEAQTGKEGGEVKRILKDGQYPNMFTFKGDELGKGVRTHYKQDDQQSRSQRRAEGGTQGACGREAQPLACCDRNEVRVGAGADVGRPYGTLDISFTPVALNRGKFCLLPWGHLAIPEDNFSCHSWGGGREVGGI